MTATDPASVTALGQHTADQDDRVLPLTRGVSLAIIPFLVLAFAALYPVPSDTGRFFAWPIKPAITPMILASVYIGGAYFFARAATARQWHTVKGGFVPVGTFATLMGVATIIHWDKFSHSRVAFWLWAGLYFTTPFIIFWVWWANRRRDVPATSADLLLSAGVSRVIAVLGALSGLGAVFLFVFPGQAVRIWPWTLTPLTAQVMGAIFALGSAGLGVLADRRWTTARILFQVAAVMLVLILIGGARAYGEFRPSNPMTWLLGAEFTAGLATSTILYARMQARAGQASHDMDTGAEPEPGTLLERRLGSDSTTCGIPPSKDPIGARERRKAERKNGRQSSERDPRADRKRGGQPGHPGAGLPRHPDPDERTEVPPPAESRGAGPGWRARTWWSQVWDVKIARFVTEYLLPLLACPCCGKVNAARGPGQSYPGSVS
jgi:hypothetical protein